MTKAVANWDICFIKAVLLLCKYGHFTLNFASHGPSPSSNTNMVNLNSVFDVNFYFSVYPFLPLHRLFSKDKTFRHPTSRAKLEAPGRSQ